MYFLALYSGSLGEWFIDNEGWKDMALFVAAFSLCTAVFRLTTVSLIRVSYARLLENLKASRSLIIKDGAVCSDNCFVLTIDKRKIVVSRDEYNDACAEICSSSLDTLLNDYQNETSRIWVAYRLNILTACVLVALLAPLHALSSILSVFVTFPIVVFVYEAVSNMRHAHAEVKDFLNSHSAIYNRIRNKRARIPAFQISAVDAANREKIKCSRAQLIFAGRGSGLITAQSPPPTWACKNCPVSNISTAEFKTLAGDAEYPQFTHVTFDKTKDSLTARS